MNFAWVRIPQVLPFLFNFTSFIFLLMLFCQLNFCDSFLFSLGNRFVKQYNNGKISKQIKIKEQSKINIILLQLPIQMFQGQRLQYLVPGYTGHIPHKVYDNDTPLQQTKPTGKIPGYAGYVPSIKPQNLYANTYGKITLDVNQQNFVKGQDVPARHKYVSTQQQVCIPPSQMLQRTAADIVGVPNTRVTVDAPQYLNQTGPEMDQFTLTKTEGFKQKYDEYKSQQLVQSKTIVQNGKEYVVLQKPIPGYTGFGRRVMANNIFGKTFAECMKQSQNDTKRLINDKNKNFNTQLNTQPPLKF